MAGHSPPADTLKSGERQAGRPYDRSGDGMILAATLDLLTERSYDRVTLDDVAARAGKAKTTIYRRWATKDDLVLAAIHSIGQPPEVADLPDEGTLRADLLAVIDSPWLGGPARRILIFAGLTSAARSSAGLADAIRLQVTEPYVDVYRRILERAIDRGEVPEQMATRVPILADIIPAMSSHRVSTTSEHVHRDFYIAVIDDVLLPALVPKVTSSSEEA
ncbi:TetR/AcrR family transcriptional regulator [Subtercola boreus]|uniref:HTH tetR-type domain-containing protein n=1 Tax=Subtercola boreus TaxID=120213 RepID=A0A3E0WCE3_9MICO|nr:TetR/AcrR family transcriptional regulator [Subtercola boreus]RFA20534.1 hypothetical protein B7R24_08855 [Subtercola boreus]RFA20649.1 hypothetical protein B7R23_08790 [Subtercola boreus]RFA26859.1 hypothetical protein B7R25_08920 [Subtercola boreus]